jgi:hypothetical protein
MSAADVVLDARYNAPRLIFAVDAAAPKAVQRAQLALADGLAKAEREMVACGFSRTTSQHLARMAVLMFLSAFDGAEAPAGVVYDATCKHVDKERWTKRIGTGARP